MVRRAVALVPRRAVVPAVLTLLLAGTSYAIAARSAGRGDGDTIYACVTRAHHTLNLTHKRTRCPRGQRKISWRRTGRGANGRPGRDGARGERGPAGAAGQRGAPGATGPPGARGPAGEAGQNGAPGASGPAGPAGPPGATGDTGPAGAIGPPGPPGPTPDSSVLSAFNNAAAPISLGINDPVPFATAGSRAGTAISQLDADSVLISDPGFYRVQYRLSTASRSPLGAVIVQLNGTDVPGSRTTLGLAGAEMSNTVVTQVTTSPSLVEVVVSDLGLTLAVGTSATLTIERVA